MNIGQDILDRNVQSLETGDEIQPVGQVIINYGTDENGITLSKAYPLPAETGRVLELSIETITDGDEVEEMAENIYNRYHKVVGGVTYDDVHEAFSVSGTELSPLMELGDGVTVNYTSYSDIGNLTTDFTKAMYADIESQGIPEEDDFPYLSNLSNKTEKELKTVKASLRVTATEIRSEVSGWTGITATAWSSTTTYAINEVCYLNGVYYKSKAGSNINHQPPDSQWWDVYTEQSRTESYVTSSITQSANSIKAEVYGSYAETYSSSKRYYVNDVVKYTPSGSTSYSFYKCISVGAGSYIQGVAPTNTTYWQNIGSSISVQSLIDLNLNGITIGYSASASDNSAYIKLNKDGVQIAGGTITMSNVVASSISADNVTAGTLSADVEYVGELSADQITSGTISAEMIGTGTLTLGDSRNYGMIYLSDNGELGYLGDTMYLANGDGDLYLQGNGYNGCVFITGNGQGYCQLENYLGGNESFRPTSSATYDLGANSFKWDTVYANTSSWATSDRSVKENINYDITSMDAFFDELKPCSYTLINGTSGRTHYGMIAQDIEETLLNNNMSGTDFAGFGKSKLVIPDIDENGKFIGENETDDYTYSLRYEEFIPLCISQIQKLKARVAQLEANTN